ncbi:glycoside hydrolase family 31 protein [Sphingosinicella terrae]|uniref:glycoside hydrolase family 31 protein n=1 Tax=Sphingosinicella terrae TaxID=2172047 RepID=UPI0025492596|nr:TIM-barrel domain-containing protein [Sphingosinicella terrae]
MTIRRTTFRLCVAASMAGAGSQALAEGSYRRIDTGILVTPDRGPERRVRLQVYGDGIIRVTAVPTADIDIPASLMVTAEPQAGGFGVSEEEGRVVLTTARASAEVDLADGAVRFRDAAGNIVLAETAPAAFAPATAEGRSFLSVRQQFNRGTDEGLYGLGQHQNAQMNYNGEDVELAQHNMDIAVPFIVSTRNYGLLWDNNSITRFGDPRPYAFVGERLRVTGAGGQPGFTASYYLGDRLALTRQEASIDYQYIEDQARWPAEARAETAAATSGQNTAGNVVQTQRVVWNGTIHPETTGRHKFRLYSSSYVKVFVDGRQVLERWRQNWNPWYHNFDLDLVAGRPAEVRIEWEPNAGYIALLHNDPLPDPDRHSISFASELGHGLDYYFIGAADMDGVIAGYRQLTGEAPMMPRWAYGFWQSRQRYETQEQLLDVVREYRRRGLPLDNIVQDWFYWPENAWGSHDFDPARFPDPQGMIDEVHRLNARFMISVWPKFYPTTENYRELQRVGAVYERNVESGDRDWVGPGYLSTFYDPYNRRGREIYWRQIRENLADLGVDAWWLDATEPDLHSNLSIEQRAYRMGPTALGPGAAFFNSYPLVHADGMYRSMIEYRPDVRPFILTRSGFGGIQRTASALWSGDVASRWDDLRDQISAGVNLSMSGIPNWTHDIGGFALEDRFTRQDPAHVEEWRELNLRWFQFGAFSPLFRSHGEAPRREIYEIAPEGSAMYRSMEWYDRLRYRLMPYIYTLAGDAHHRDGTIMRGLVMDFPADRRTWNIDDQYLFGPAFLVAPVTEFRARQRDVYLPAGALWYDFHSGRSRQGGQTIRAEAPYEHMPLFVRAGSIVPMGPAVQHSGEGLDAPITLRVYTGADGSFSLYEDDGTSRQYHNGAWSRIPLRYDERTGTLTLGPREGGFPGMIASRTFHIVWMRPDGSRPLEFDARPDATVRYDGRQQSVALR